MARPPNGSSQGLVAAVVLAAGAGRRMASPTPKQFLRLGGKPVFSHSLEFFFDLEAVGEICLVLSPGAIEGPEAKDARSQAVHAGKTLSIASGGKRRQDSTRAGLRALSPEVQIVLVHDAARPFPPRQACLDSIAAAREVGGAILAAPASDTIKIAEANGERIEKTLDRSRLWLAQTPQTFRFADLIEAMESAQRDGVDLTDEAMAFERLGRPVRIIASNADNLKITVAEDLIRAEQILARRMKG